MSNTNKVAPYRLENQSVYEYVEEQNVYVFIGNLHGEPLGEFIREYEYQLDLEFLDCADFDLELS